MKRLHTKTKVGAGLILCLLLSIFGCQSKPNSPPASITITRVPQADATGGNKTDVIRGETNGAVKDDRVVLYAQTGDWWVQPLPKQPFADLDNKLYWINGTHLGTHYAALLVRPSYVPIAHLVELPKVGGDVKAVISVPGAANSPSPYISFSGYEWRARSALSNRGGTMNHYAVANAFTDPKGALHLQVTGGPKDWTCAEVTLVESLGYGTYSFEMSDVLKLEPSAVFAFFTFDYAGGDENNREANIEVSRWGNPTVKNGQYVVQPYHVPANVSRFMIPASPVIHSLEWSPGKMTFRSATKAGKVFSEHVFASGIPTPGLESPRMAFYVYNQGLHKQERASEVLIERFKFLP